MRRGAVILAASISLALGACTMDKSSELAGQSGVQTDERTASSIDNGVRLPPVTKDSSHDSTTASTSAGAQLADANVEQTSGKIEDSTAGSEPVSVDGNSGNDGGVRDAKEAAEEAARKILDATLGAANKIKEVGLGAVQSVRDSSTRSKDEQESDELAASGASTDPAE
ncbi:hypothetical protein ACKVEX_08315 [Rhodocyclaceae bacterium SMB388]